MRTAKILVIFGIMLLIAGCVRSLHPLFIEKDLVFEPALVGTWVDEDNNTWAFQKSKDNTYKFIYTEYNSIFSERQPLKEGVPAEFVANLVQLGEILFLDISPVGPDIKNDFYLSHLIPTHTFLKIRIEEDVLHLAMLDYNWLKEMIDSKKVNINHERLGDEPGSMIVLTASTKELQEFVVKYTEDEKAFQPGELHRQK